MMSLTLSFRIICKKFEQHFSKNIIFMKFGVCEKKSVKRKLLW